ncbi:MAG: DUF6701 domain-containing protein [Candidatus Omnitrophota bacterium]
MNIGICLVFVSWLLVISYQPAYAVLDTYFEDFANFTGDATVDGTDYWKVVQGTTTDAIVTNSVYYPGSSQSLKIGGASPDTIVGRAATYYLGLNPPADLYGGLTPTWVRFRVRPSYSGQIPAVPSTGIAAVCFDYTGRLLASNGSSWVNTGQAYTIGRWYEVILKLNFTGHTYDLYFFDSLVPSPQFVAVKTGLNFIDSSINKVSNFKFYGAYSENLADDIYIDYVSVNYFYRFEIITPSQKLLRGEGSSLITVQIQDFLAAPQTLPKDITLDLKSTSLSGRFSLIREPWYDVTQIVMPKFAQDVSFYYKDDKAGKPIINVAEYPDQGYLDALQQLEVVSEAAAFDVGVNDQQVAGQEFKIKITAKDDEGNINETYGGTVLLSINYESPASGKYKITPEEASGFVRGVAEVIASYPDCGTVTIAVVDKDDSGKTGESMQILFLPAQFELSVEAKQVVSKPFALSISAKNTLGQITPNYNGTVNLSSVLVSPESASGGLMTPEYLSAAEFENGRATPDANYNRYGIIKIQAADSVDGTKQGISGEVKFLPKAVSVEVELPAGRDYFYIGEPVGVLVKVLDEAGNAVVNYPGTLELSSSAGLAIIPEYTFTLQDAGRHKFSATSTEAGTYTVSANIEAGALSGESPVISVKEVYLEVIDTVAPVGTGEIVIQLVDEFGNVISSENSLSITVGAEEEQPNNSVSLPSAPVTLRDGKALITLFDTEAETVIITPYSPYKIKIRKGKIVFGQIGRTGISPQMWRELKD